MWGVKPWPHQHCPAVNGSYWADARQKIGRECSGSRGRGWHWLLAGRVDREIERVPGYWPSKGFPIDLHFTGQIISSILTFKEQ